MGQQQISTIGPGSQQEYLEVLGELRQWKDLGVDILECRAIGDISALDECTKAIAELLRGSWDRVIMLQQPARVVQRVEVDPAMPLTVATGDMVAQEVPAVTPAQKEPPKRRSTKGYKLNLTDEDRAARAERIRAAQLKSVAARAARKAASTAQANSLAPEPVVEAPAPMPTVNEPRTSVGERMEQCAQEVRVLVTDGGFGAADVPVLAKRHNLTPHTVDALWAEEIRRSRKAQKQAVPA